jgi:hypothetical protein
MYIALEGADVEQPPVAMAVSVATVVSGVESTTYLAVMIIYSHCCQDEVGSLRCQILQILLAKKLSARSRGVTVA